MVLDAENPVPLYFQLKTIIESRITGGEFNPGDKIPSENQLCEEYSVSRTTARQAIAELVNSGKLVRTQGRGTFVANEPMDQLLYRLTGFSADMKKQGYYPSSKVLDFRVVMPKLDILKYLQLNPTEAVIYLKRLRYLDGQVMGLERTYLPFKRFSQLNKEEIENDSLYGIITKKYEIIPMRTLLNFEAIPCSEKLCGLLEMPQGAPILHMYDVTFDQYEHVFEYTHTYYRGDLYTFHVEINKNVNDNRLLIQKTREDESNEEE